MEGCPVKIQEREELMGRELPMSSLINSIELTIIRMVDLTILSGFLNVEPVEFNA